MPVSPQLKSALQLYSVNPTMFTSEEADFLQNKANELGIKFHRNTDADEFNLGNTLNQFVSGVVEGFTTLGWADTPETTTEALAANIGHLIGFAPDVIAGVLSGGASIPLSITKKGVIKGGMRTAASKIAQQSAKKGPFALRSIPMRGADYVMNKGVQGLAKAGFEGGKFFAKGKVPRDILRHGVHLGIASGISAWKEGPEGIASSVAHGALIGSAFGSIGNFVRVEKMLGHVNPKVIKVGEKQLETAAKALIGAGFQGGMSSFRGDPMPIQVYEYLMGGFFGANSRPAYKNEANKHIQRMQKNKNVLSPFKPEITEGYESLGKEAKSYIDDYVNRYHGEILDSNEPISTAFFEIAKRLHNTEEPTKEQIIEVSKKELPNIVEAQEKAKSDQAQTEQSVRSSHAKKFYDKYLAVIEKTDDPLKKLSALQRIKNRVAYDKSDTSDIESIIKPIEKELKSQGYEILDLKGQSYDTGKTLIVVQAVEDGTLKQGESIIDQVRKPQIMKDGKLVQAAEVVVRVGIRKLTAKEFKQEELKLEKEWAEKEKALNHLGSSKDTIASHKKAHDDYAKRVLEELRVEVPKKTKSDQSQTEQSVGFESNLTETTDEIYHVTNRIMKVVGDKKLKASDPEIENDVKGVYLSALKDWSGKFNDVDRIVFDRKLLSLTKGQRADESEYISSKDIPLDSKSGLKRIERKTTVELDHYLVGGLAQNEPTWTPARDRLLSIEMMKKEAALNREKERINSQKIADKLKVPVILEDRPELETRYKEIFYPIEKATKTPTKEAPVETPPISATEGVNVMRGSKYGNPFVVPEVYDKSSDTTKAYYKKEGFIRAKSREDAIQSYEDWIRGTAHEGFLPQKRAAIIAGLESGELKGKTLKYFKPDARDSHAVRLAKLVVDQETPTKEAPKGDVNTVKEGLEKLFISKKKEIESENVGTEYGLLNIEVKPSDVEKAYWDGMQLFTRADKNLDLAGLEEGAARTHLGEFSELSNKEAYNDARFNWRIREDTSVKIDFDAKNNKVIFSLLDKDYDKAMAFDMVYGAVEASQKRLGLSYDTGIVVKTNHTYKIAFNKISDILGKPPTQEAPPVKANEGINIANPNETLSHKKGYSEYLIHTDTGKRRVSGKPVELDILPEYDFFVWKNDKNWVVTEATSGKSVSAQGSTTMKSAIESSLDRIKRHGIDKFKEALRGEVTPQETKPVETKPALQTKEETFERVTETTDLGDDIIAYNNVLDYLTPHIREKSKLSQTEIRDDLYRMVDESGGNYAAFSKALNEYSPDSTRPRGFERSIKTYLNNFQQNTNRPVRSYVIGEGFVKDNERGPATEATKQFGGGIDVTINRIYKPLYKTKDGKKVKVFDKEYKIFDDEIGFTDERSGQWVEPKPAMGEKQWRDLEYDLQKDGYYIYEGSKDKGILIARKMHRDVDRMDFKKDFLPMLLKEDPYAYRVFKLDQKLELKRLGATTEENIKHYTLIHEEKVLSNILYAMDETGLSFAETMKSYSNVIDRNKRVPLSRGSEYNLKDTNLEGVVNEEGKIPYIILNDTRGDSFIDSNGKKRFFDSDTDGGEHLHPDLFDKVIDRFASDKESGFIKSVHNIRDPKYGLQLDKVGVFRATEAMTKFMDRLGVKRVIFRSGVKVDSKRQSYDYSVKNGVWRLKGKGSKTPETYGELPEEFKVNTSIYDSRSKMGGNQRVVKQLSGMMNRDQMPTVVDKETGEYTDPLEVAVEKIYRPTVMGDEVVNREINKYVSGEKVYVEGVINQGEGTKGINPDAISSNNIATIIFQNSESKMASDILKYIFRRGQEDKWFSHNVSEVKEAESRSQEYSDLTRLQETLERGDYDFAIWMMPDIRLGVEKAVGNYLIDRTYKPKWKYSGYTRFINNTLEHIEKYNVQPGEFYLESSRRSDKVLFQGNETTRGELWDSYLKAKEAGHNVEAYEDSLSFFGGRVPVTSPSGIRSLKFKGFIDEKGYGVLLHPEDKFNFGGADNDADGAFFYHGFPKEVIKSFKDNKDDLKDSKGRSKDLKDRSLDKRYFKIDTNTDAYSLFHSPSSQFMSTMRMAVAKGAYEGNKNMGISVNTSNMLQSLLSTVIREGGKMTMKHSNGKIDLEVRKHKGEVVQGDFFRYLGTNAQNRAADAANYIKMSSGKELQQMLFENAFKATFTNENGKTRVAKYNDLFKTEYKRLTDLNNKLFGYNFKENRSHTVKEMFDAIRAFNHSDVQFEGMLAEITKEVSLPEAVLDPMSKLNIDKAAKELALQNRQGDFKDGSEFLKYAGRVKLDLYNDKTSQDIVYLVNDFSDYLITKELIVPLGKRIVDAVENVGGTREEGFDILSGIAEDATNLKNQSLHGRRQGKKVGISMKDKQVLIDKEIVRINDNLASMESAIGLPVGTLKRYFEAYILSPLKNQDLAEHKAFKSEMDKLDWHLDNLGESEMEDIQISKKILIDRKYQLKKAFSQTTRNNIGWDSKQIPGEVKDAYIDIFRKGMGKYIKGRVAAEPPEPIQNKASDPEPTVAPLDSQINAEVIIQKIPEINYEEVVKKGYDVNVTDEQSAHVKKFVSNIKKYNLENQMHEVFPGITSENEIIGKSMEIITFSDVANFNRYISHVERGLLFKKYKKGDLPMRKAFHYLFYGRLNELLLSSDFKPMEKDGTPVLRPDGSLIVTTTKVPMSTIGVVQRTAFHSQNHINKFTELYEDKKTKQFQYLANVENGNELFSIAVRQMTRRGDGRKYSSDEARKLSLKRYMDRWAEVKPKWDKLLKEKKKYRIPDENGNMKDVTAVQLVQRIKSDARKYFKDMSDKVVHKPYDESSVIDPITKRMKKSFIIKVLKPVMKETPFSKVQIEGWNAVQRIRYEMNLEDIVELMVREGTLKDANAPNFRHNYRTKKDKEGNLLHPIPTIGEISNETYFPQRGQFSTKHSRKINEAALKEMEADYREAILNKRIPLPKFILDKVVKGDITEQEGMERAILEQKRSHERIALRSLSDDSLMGEESIEWLFHRPKNVEEATRLNLFTRPGSSLKRGEVILPEFRDDIDVLSDYTNEWVRAYFNDLVAIRAKLAVKEFIKKKPVGESTGQWADFILEITKRIMGYPSFFSEKIYGISPKKGKAIRAYLAKGKLSNKDDELVRESASKIQEELMSGLSKEADFIQQEHNLPREQAMNRARDRLTLDKSRMDKELKNLLKDEDRLKAYGTGYSLYSDEAVVKFLDKASQKLTNGKIPFYGELPKNPEIRKQTLARLAHRWGMAEAKWELITLLTHFKTSIGNIMGGSENTISSAGLRHYRKANNTSYLLNNVFQNAFFELENPKTGRLEKIPLNNRKNIGLWLESIGVIDSFYKTEGGLDKAFRTPQNKAFVNAIAKKIAGMRKSNPDLSDKDMKLSVYELGKEHGITKSVMDKAASFMQKSEIWLRQNAFLAHYLNAREALLPMSENMKWDDPTLIYFGKKGVEATQFLYHSAFRTNYSNTALGKVMTRFQPFAWNSIKFRRHVYQTAKIYGFNPGTEAFKRYQRLVTMDMFALAMGGIFVGSIFEYAMAPPMSWAMDTAQWLFGDERERERAFFSQFPTTAFAPLQPFTAPILRYPLNLITTMVNGDFDRYASFYIHTYYPFGRLVRDGARTIKNPAMLIENMTGMPVHKLQRLMVKNRKEKEVNESM